MGLDVDVAVMNGGGIRNKGITGEISYLTCKSIHTFGNMACLQTVTGQQILDALEWGARDVGTAESGGFLQVSGLKYTVDASIPCTVQEDEKGVWIGAPTGAYRVREVQVLNRESKTYVPLDLNAKYNLAGYNYTLRDMGDGFAAFEGAVNVLDYVMEDYMVLANYVQSFEGGKVTGYAAPQGRITIQGVSAEQPAVQQTNSSKLFSSRLHSKWCLQYRLSLSQHTPLQQVTICGKSHIKPWGMAEGGRRFIKSTRIS